MSARQRLLCTLLAALLVACSAGGGPVTRTGVVELIAASGVGHEAHAQRASVNAAAYAYFLHLEGRTGQHPVLLQPGRRELTALATGQTITVSGRQLENSEGSLSAAATGRLLTSAAAGDAANFSPPSMTVDDITIHKAAPAAPSTDASQQDSLEQDAFHQDDSLRQHLPSRSRRLSQASDQQALRALGPLNVLVVRVSMCGQAPALDVEELRALIFRVANRAPVRGYQHIGSGGSNLDTAESYTLEDAYGRCSYGKASVEASSVVMVNTTVSVCDPGLLPLADAACSNPELSTGLLTFGALTRSLVDGALTVMGINPSDYDRVTMFMPVVPSCKYNALGTVSCVKGTPCSNWLITPRVQSMMAGTAINTGAGPAAGYFGFADRYLQSDALKTTNFWGGDYTDSLGGGSFTCFNAPNMMNLGWSTPIAMLGDQDLPSGVPLRFTIPAQILEERNFVAVSLTGQPIHFISYRRSESVFDQVTSSVYLHTNYGSCQADSISSGVLPCATNLTGQLQEWGVWVDSATQLRVAVLSVNETSAEVQVCRSTTRCPGEPQLYLTLSSEHYGWPGYWFLNGSRPAGYWDDSPWFRAPAFITRITSWSGGSPQPRILGLQVSYNNGEAPVRGNGNASLTRGTVSLSQGEVIMSVVLYANANLQPLQLTFRTSLGRNAVLGSCPSNCTVWSIQPPSYARRDGFLAALMGSESRDPDFVQGSSDWSSLSQVQFVWASSGNDPCACIFPFVYKNRTYTQCTSDDNERLWCMTSPTCTTAGPTAFATPPGLRQRPCDPSDLAQGLTPRPSPPLPVPVPSPPVPVPVPSPPVPSPPVPMPVPVPGPTSSQPPLSSPVQPVGTGAGGGGDGSSGSSGSGSSTDLGAAVGGAVGGTAALALVATLVLWWRRPHLLKGAWTHVGSAAKWVGCAKATAGGEGAGSGTGDGDGGGRGAAGLSLQLQAAAGSGQASLLATDSGQQPGDGRSQLAPASSAKNLDIGAVALTIDPSTSAPSAASAGVGAPGVSTPAQGSGRLMSPVGGSANTVAVQIAQCIYLAEEVVGAVLWVKTSPARCQQLATGAARLLPTLHQLYQVHALQPPATGQRPEEVLQDLRSICSTMAACKGMMEACGSRTQPMSLQEAALLMSSVQHEDTFARLQLELQNAARRLIAQHAEQGRPADQAGSALGPNLGRRIEQTMSWPRASIPAGAHAASGLGPALSLPHPGKLKSPFLSLEHGGYSPKQRVHSPSGYGEGSANPYRKQLAGSNSYKRRELLQPTGSGLSEASALPHIFEDAMTSAGTAAGGGMEVAAGAGVAALGLMMYESGGDLPLGSPLGTLGSGQLEERLSEQDSSTMRDLRELVRRAAAEGGVESWGPDTVNQVRQLCSRHGLDFDGLLDQERSKLLLAAQSLARTQAIAVRLEALDYIRLEEVHGPEGPGTPMTFLARGGAGTVYKGMWQGEEVVVKRIESATQARMQEEVVREVYIMSSCRHPNIAQVYGLARDEDSGVVCLVMRYYRLGSLETLLHGANQGGASQGSTQPAQLTVGQKLQMALDIARGMAYLHSRPNELIVHGDLKPGNVLVDEGLRCYVSDFGAASMHTDTRTLAPSSNAQSLCYSAPELLEALQGVYSGGAEAGAGAPRVKRTLDMDVYGYGMTLFELFTGDVPFDGVSSHHVAWLVTSGRRPTFPVLGAPHQAGAPGHIGDQGSLQPEGAVPKPVACIIESCWQQEPFMRPSFTQLVPALEAAAAALSTELD